MTYAKDTYKGYFVPINPQKYVGDPDNIIYRSSYELKFMKWCDNNKSVIKWASEELAVPYISPIDKKYHRYFIDFLIEVQDREGKIKKYMVEVKPYKYTQPPVPQARKTKRFISEVKQWGVNQAKWEAASTYASKQGWQFIIITEKELGLGKTL